MLCKSLAKKMKEGLESVGLAYAWQSQQEFCFRNEISLLFWMKAGVILDESRSSEAKMIRKGLVKGMCHLCMGNEHANHILLNCSETKKWRKHFMSKNMTMHGWGTRM
jgi:hypothetical protein